MNEIKIDIPAGMCIDMQESNFNQGIIRFKPNINWNIVYKNAEKCTVSSIFPKKTKIMNSLIHLASYLNSITECTNDESWTICRNRYGDYIPVMSTGALISFKTMDIAKIAINIIGKSDLDVLFNESYKK